MNNRKYLTSTGVLLKSLHTDEMQNSNMHNVVASSSVYGNQQINSFNNPNTLNNSLFNTPSNPYDMHYQMNMSNNPMIVPGNALNSSLTFDMIYFFILKSLVLLRIKFYVC